MSKWCAPQSVVIPPAVIPPPLTSKGEARARLSIPKDTQLVVSVARLDPIKRHDVLIRAVARLPEDTMLALVIVHSLLTLPFTVLIMTMFFRKIPVEIEEAAVVDGASPLQTFWRITLPLSAASLVATGLFSFMLSYSEFMYSLVLGGSERSRTLPVVMSSLIYNPDMIWGLTMAGVFLTLIPSLILAIVVWKFVVENIILGASKY